MLNFLFDFLLVFVLVTANGVFAMAEIALVSARESRLKRMDQSGHQGAKVALKLMEAPTNFLSTIQIGISLVGILAGALSGATLAKHLTPVLEQVEWLAPYSSTISLALMVILVTYLSLVVGELVPKRLALNNPEGISARLARPMNFLSRLGAPLVRILTFSTEAVVRLLGVKVSEEPPVTEEELKSLLAQGTEAGIFEDTEHEVVRRALELDDRSVTTVMVPRRDVVGLDINDSREEIIGCITECGFSRLPVFDGDFDHVVGIVRVPELLAAYAEGQALDLQDHLYEPVFVPRSATPTQVLELFRNTKIHTVLVVDEYGGTMGLVTPTNILEFIVGQLPTLKSTEDPAEIIKREDGTWLVDGLTSLPNLMARLPNATAFSQISRRIQTVNGFIMNHLGHIPKEGETFIWGHFKFEVIDMDSNRVDKVLITDQDQ